MKNKFIIFFLPFCVLLSLVFWLSSLDGSVDKPIFTGSTVGEFDALYWHRGDNYTLVSIIDKKIVKSKMSDSLKDVNGDYCQIETVTVIIDLEDKKRPWYNCRCYAVGQPGRVAQCEIHIKGLDNMKTAEFRYGKFGTGVMTRLE
jgi:hypothetical protein